jgi:hypothetical protein
MYKKGISRSQAFEILINLENEVSGIKMIQCFDIKEARRSEVG